MRQMEPVVVHIGDMMIQYGCNRKTGTSAAIRFRENFATLPCITISSVATGGGQGVRHAETITAIGKDSFTLMSGNGNSRYFVSWIAVGPREGASQPIQEKIEVNDFILLYGRTPKTVATYTQTFGRDIGPAPNVLISPFYKGNHGGAGHAETITNISGTGFSGAANNGHTDYSVNWMAIADGRRGYFLDVDPAENPSTDSTFLIRGSYSKDSGSDRAPFIDSSSSPASPMTAVFGASPVVVLSPRFTTGVGHQETITSIDGAGFNMHSGNASSPFGGRYIVEYVAIGNPSSALVQSATRM